LAFSAGVGAEYTSGEASLRECHRLRTGEHYSPLGEPDTHSCSTIRSSSSRFFGSGKSLYALRVSAKWVQPFPVGPVSCESRSEYLERCW
jgi:hypothetical protein